MTPRMIGDPKQAAIRLWSAAPCGTEETGGTEQQIRRQIAEAERYAPWLADAVGIPEAGGRDVLDVGCGPGILLARFALAGARVEGVDLVPEHVERARANLATLGLAGEARIGDGEQLPYPDERFDLVVANNALQFTTDFDAALREARRVLRPGGSLRLVLYHRRSAFLWGRIVLANAGALRRTRSLDAVLARSLPWASGDPDFVARSFTARGLEARLRGAGFAHVDSSVHGFSWDHVPAGPALAARVGALRSERVLRRLDGAAGWYLAAVARR
jgi:SAM-dependent methyltransferase